MTWGGGLGKGCGRFCGAEISQNRFEEPGGAGRALAGTIATMVATRNATAAQRVDVLLNRKGSQPTTERTSARTKKRGMGRGEGMRWQGARNGGSLAIPARRGSWVGGGHPRPLSPSSSFRSQSESWWSTGQSGSTAREGRGGGRGGEDRADAFHGCSHYKESASENCVMSTHGNNKDRRQMMSHRAMGTHSTLHPLPPVGFPFLKDFLSINFYHQNV